MVPLYRYFARWWDHCLDFSEDALYEMYWHESRGEGHPAADNGYHVGKRYLNVAVAQWREDMFKTLWPWELYQDPDLPDWWLDREFPEARVWRDMGWLDD